jgi:hypothetical protein
LHVVTAEIRHVSEDDHGIPVTPPPLNIDTMLPCVVNDAIEHVVGRNGKDAGPDLFECQLHGISFRDPRARHHGNDGLDSPFFKLEGQDNSIQLEENAGIMNLGWQLVGEVRDQVLGQPGVDLLIRKNGLPRVLVDDIVA